MTYEAYEAALALGREGVIRMGEVVNIRDFKRKEEDTGPSETIPYQGSGIDGIPFNLNGNQYDPTPLYTAEEKDPA